MTEFHSDDLLALSVALDFAARLVQVEPDEDWVRCCIDEALFSAAPFGGEDDAVKQGLSLMEAWCAASDHGSKEHVDALRREWLRLFVGLGAPEASTSESFYVDPNAALFSSNTLAVRSIYRAWGIENARQSHEPDDTLGMMLAFCAHLVRTAADQGADPETAQKALAAFEEFLVQHLLPWASAWRFLVSKHAKTDYYRGVGEFVFGLERACAVRFGIAFDEKSGAFSYTRP